MFRAIYLRLLRWRILLRFSGEGDSQMDKPQNSLPWYEGTLLWGAIGVAVTLIATYVGFATRDIRWFLVAAWPFCALVALALAGEIARFRLLLTIAGSLFAGIILFGISRYLPPPNDTDISTQIRQGFQSLKGQTQTKQENSALTNKNGKDDQATGEKREAGSTHKESQPPRHSGLRPPHFDLTEISVTKVPHTPALYQLNFLLTNVGDDDAQNFEGKIIFTSDSYRVKILPISSANEIFHRPIMVTSEGFYVREYALEQYFSIRLCYRDSSDPKRYIPPQIFSYMWKGMPDNVPSPVFRMPGSDEIKRYDAVIAPDPVMQQLAFCTQAPEPR
jgi:hypothetical protein